MRKNLRIAVEAALEAGKAILQIYEQDDFGLEYKADKSPLTLADREANFAINRILSPSEIPIISEENKQIPYEQRKGWQVCWIVDPLDGTKEFINRNGEFTVNIALAIEGKSELGVIFAPALNVLYFSIVSEAKAFKISDSGEEIEVDQLLHSAKRIFPGREETPFRILSSRSHINERTLSLIEELQKKKGKVEVIPKGSSLKFCDIAEGNADIYPRLGTTMEWDTAAGQAICEAVEIPCISAKTGKNLIYNKPDLRNEHFVVSNEG